MTEQHHAPQDPEHDAAGSPARPPAGEPVGGQEQADRTGAEHAEPAASESARDQAGGSEADGPVADGSAADGSAAEGSDAAEAVPAEAVRDKTIGQVLSHLDGDFPGLTASKVRFLEDRGLLHPERTATGYRKYSLQDIERLRYILCLQRDHYLPLKVIRDRVEALERRGELPTAQLLARLEALPGFGEQKARIFAALLGKQLGVTPDGWRETIGPYAEEGSRRSVADVVDAVTLQEVRDTKKQTKAAKKAAAQRD